MSCKYLDNCPSPREIGTGPIYKRRFCMHDCERCARFVLMENDKSIFLPRWIRPTMMAHAEQILMARANGFQALPDEAPREQAVVAKRPENKRKRKDRENKLG